MNYEQLLLIVIVMFVAAAVYTTREKRGKILCHFTFRDKTEEDKWVKMRSDGTVVHRGMKFDVLPDRVTSFWWTKGFNFLFPTRVNYCKFSWYSRWPHDPNDYNKTSMDPTVREAMNKDEWVKSFARNSNPSGVKKQSMLWSYMPIITLAVVVIMGFYLYTEIESIKTFTLALQNSFNTLVK